MTSSGTQRVQTVRQAPRHRLIVVASPAVVITSGLVNVFTDDIQAPLGFYQGVLGLPETFRTPSDGAPEHVEMRAGGPRCPCLDR